MLERTDAITNEVLKPITFVLEYPTLFQMQLSVIQFTIKMFHAGFMQVLIL